MIGAEAQERSGRYYMALYKQAGNSIPVPIFESIFKKIILGQTNKTNQQQTIFDDKEE